MVGISKGTVFAAAERACLVVMHANKEARESILAGKARGRYCSRDVLSTVLYIPW
jgi:hypothetical protein